MDIQSKIVNFTLINPNSKMTERQQDKVYFAIKLGDWENFKDLISIELVGDVQDRGFTVKVDQLNDKWHSKFSQVICNKALLHDFRMDVDGRLRLFEATEIN